MKAVQAKLNEQTTPNSLENGILVKDLLQYLSSLAKLNDDAKTGNLELAAGLRDLAKSLRPFSNRPTAELPDSLALGGRASASTRRKSAAKDKVELPAELDDISHDDVERILEDSRYTKTQLAELGFRRFGISRASLTHRSKKDAVESIRSALGNERTLDAISEAARKAGKARAF